MFCPSYHMWIGERCRPVVKKLYAQGIVLTLSSIFIDGIIPSPRYITKENKYKPENMVRSECLDLKWSFISVIAEYDEETNTTQSLAVHLIKMFNNEKDFNFSQTLTKYATCIPSEWEMLINGHWFPVHMGFTSGVLKGRVTTKSDLICTSKQQDTSMLHKTYQITKMDYCKQVNIKSVLKHYIIPKCDRTPLHLVLYVCNFY